MKEYTLARDWLYDKKISSSSLERTTEEMINRVTPALASEWRSGAFVDEYMRDQLVIFQALSRGRSEVFAGREKGGLREASLHARTAEWVAREVLGVRFGIEGRCEGVGVGGEEGIVEIGEVVGRVEL